VTSLAPLTETTGCPGFAAVICAGWPFVVQPFHGHESHSGAIQTRCTPPPIATFSVQFPFSRM